MSWSDPKGGRTVFFLVEVGKVDPWGLMGLMVDNMLIYVDVVFFDKKRG